MKVIKNKAGQELIQSLLIGFLAVIILVQLLPTIHDLIQIALPSLDTTTQVLLSLVPLFFVVAILGWILVFGRARSG